MLNISTWKPKHPLPEMDGHGDFSPHFFYVKIWNYQTNISKTHIDKWMFQVTGRNDSVTSKSLISFLPDEW